MESAEHVARERRQFWDVRARIEQIENRSTPERTNGYPDSRGAEALVREQFRRATGERGADNREPSV